MTELSRTDLVIPIVYDKKSTMLIELSTLLQIPERQSTAMRSSGTTHRMIQWVIVLIVYVFE